MVTRLEPRVRLAAVVLVAAIAAVLLVTLVRGCGDGGPPAEAAARLAPAGTLVWAHASTDGERDAVGAAEDLLERFDAYEPRRDGILRTLSGADRPVGEGDVAPWLGDEAALALVESGQATAGSLVLIEVTDRAAAERFLARNPRRPAVREYKDVPVSTYGAVSTAFVGDFLAIGQQPTVQGAIDRQLAGGAGSLARTDVYRRAVAGLPGDRAGHAYATADGLRRLLVPQGDVLGALAVLFDRPALRGVAVSLQGRDEGARLVAHSILDPAVQRREGDRGEPFAPALLDDVPGDALGLLSVRGITASLGRLVGAAAGVAGSGDVGPGLEGLRRQLERAGGPSVRRDLLALLGGEVGIVVTGGVPAPAFSLVAPTEDEDRTRATLRRLQGPLARAFTPEGDSPARFVRADVAGAEAFTLRFGAAADRPGITYAVFDDKLVVSTGVEGIRRLRGDGPTLDETDAFDAVLSGRPDEVGSLGFLDFSQLLELGEQTGLNDSRSYLAARDDLRKVRAIGVRSSGGEGSSTAEILLSIP